MELSQAREAAILAVLTDRLRPTMADYWGTRSCVASVRIAGAVLDYFAVPWQPWPVRVGAFNAAGWQEFERDQHRPTGWSGTGGHSVGVYGSGRVRGKDWDGHLVLTTGRYFYDPSLDQLSRPHKGVELEPLLSTRPPDWPPGPGMWNHVTRDDGTRVLYGLMAEPGAWQTTPDWAGHKDAARAVAGQLIKLAKLTAPAV